MDKIQTKWKQNANEIQSGRKFRQYAAGKSHKKSAFARFWRVGVKTDRKKQQPKLLDCCLILRMNLEAIPHIPDTGNHKRRFGIYGI